MKKPNRIIFEQYLYELSFEELKSYLKKYDNKHKTKAQEEATKQKQRQLQTRVEALTDRIVCPFCQSEDAVKNGSQNGLQRYKCKNCKSSYTLTTNTFMEDTNWTWDVWVKLLNMTVNSQSINSMIDTLAKDYHLEGLSRNTVFLARHKLLFAMSLMPKPTLSGVIQADETFFRENQKGTRTDKIDPKTGKRQELINVIPEVVPIRLPRYGQVPSRLGVMGPEYACVVCAIDDNNRAISVVTSLGKVTSQQFIDQFDKHFKNVTYLCTDASPIYVEYCDLKHIPHYVKPSSYLRTLSEAGHIAGVSSRAEGEIEQAIYQDNKKILTQLYKDGLIDYIDQVGGLSYQDFYKLKQEYGLNLGRVNSFHNYLKKHLENLMTGVATKYLATYVDAYTFLYNWRHEHRTTLTSIKDAEILLCELIQNRQTFTLNDLKAKDFFVAPKPTNRYIKLLTQKTKEMRRATDNRFFKFDEEDRIVSFDYKKYLKNTSVGKLRPFGKLYHIKGYTAMSQWQLYNAIIALPKADIGKIVQQLIASDKVYSIYTEDVKYITNHKIPESELTYSKGTDLVDLERLFILDEDKIVDSDDEDDEDLPF